MTVATEIYATGTHPYDGSKVDVARSPQDKETQRSFFFWYKPEMRSALRQTLSRIGLKHLASRLLDDHRETVDVTPPPHIAPCGKQLPNPNRRPNPNSQSPQFLRPPRNKK